MNNTITIEQSSIRAYYELCKPRVVMLMLLTAIIGMLLATQQSIPWHTIILATIGIGLAAGAGGVLNQLIDRHLDAKMGRTQYRPLPSGRITVAKACIFAFALTIIGMSILVMFINTITAILTFFTLVGYGVIYTVFLKRATPQNIVIGGLAGAMPPLLGWTAITGNMDSAGLLLVLIIFVWTPPHFWALAIARHEEYAKADVPMLPVTHGIAYTKLSILLYTILLIPATVLLYAIGLGGMFYLISACVLNAIFLYYVIQLMRSDDKKIAYATFRYSILYLMLIFISLLGDHYYGLAS